MTGRPGPGVGRSRRGPADTHWAAVGPSRRAVLASIGGTSLAAVAGCLDQLDGGNEDDADGQPDLPRVEDPPGVVYVPSHREGVEPLGTVRAGPYELRPMLSYAHPFWLAREGTTTEVDVSDADAHLMIGIADAVTGTALPHGELRWTIRRDGAVHDDRSPWRMLSQQMGAHVGANVELGEDGDYEATLSLPPMGIRRGGALAGRFDEPRTATLSFTFDQVLRDRLIDAIAYVDEEQAGVPGAIEPMAATSGLPPVDALPGTLQGVPASSTHRLPRSHDADFGITVREGAPAGVTPEAAGATDEDPYLLVSPRTPYNRVPLPGMSLSADIERDGEHLATYRLRPTVDEAAGLHYGATVPALAPGDRVRVTVDAAPRVARHQGYETAFLEMEPVAVTVEGW